MAKIQKHKLQWTASESPQVVGYKLYWTQGENVDYDCRCANLGKVTEVILPDDVDEFQPVGGPIQFGITAVDESGNESDLITLVAPHQFNVPQAPGEIWIEARQEQAPQPPKAPLPETESHVSLLEHTLLGAEQRNNDQSSDLPSDGGSEIEAEKRFGLK